MFRAGTRYLRLRLVRWGLTQLVALWGVLFWLTLSYDLDNRVELARAALAEQRAAAAKSADAADDGQQAAEAEPAGADGARPRQRLRRRLGPVETFRFVQNTAARILARLPRVVLPLLWLAEVGGIVFYLTQCWVTFLLARLDFEMRWYMVTDRSLRIRHGVWEISESTMSFANVQQVMVSQGPLQRLLGLWDVKVQSAGGGSGKDERHGKDEERHVGLFHGVENPHEIRDLILARLQQFRESGLGDPDEHVAAPRAPVPAPVPDELLAAARNLREAASDLRAGLASSG